VVVVVTVLVIVLVIVAVTVSSVLMSSVAVFVLVIVVVILDVGIVTTGRHWYIIAVGRLLKAHNRVGILALDQDCLRVVLVVVRRLRLLLLR